MIKVAIKNSKKQGIVEFTLFKEDDHYVAVCLTFDIVLEGDDPSVLKQEIVRAAQLHLQTVSEMGLSEELLNRPAPKEYWDKRGGLIETNTAPMQGSYETSTYTQKEGLFVTC
jgi:hypothetical protein